MRLSKSVMDVSNIGSMAGDLTKSTTSLVKVRPWMVLKFDLRSSNLVTLFSKGRRKGHR